MEEQKWISVEELMSRTVDMEGKPYKKQNT